MLAAQAVVAGVEWALPFGASRRHRRFKMSANDSDRAGVRELLGELVGQSAPIADRVHHVEAPHDVDFDHLPFVGAIPEPELAVGRPPVGPYVWAPAAPAFGLPPPRLPAPLFFAMFRFSNVFGLKS